MPVRVFDNDDQAYFRWMEDHPEGFVVNSTRGEGSAYYVLHKAGCHHISADKFRAPGGYTERQYLKVCSTNVHELAHWGMENRKLNGEPFGNLCGTCKPVPKTYLLVWNPNNFPWEDLHTNIESLQNGEDVEGTWSCGPSRNIEPGSRFIMMRAGDEHRGVIGSGWITSSPYPEAHWNPTLAEEGKEAWYVEIRYDSLQEFPLIPWEELDTPLLSPLRKQLQASGTSISTEAAIEVERLFAGRLSLRTNFTYPDEIEATEDAPIFEGAKKTVQVNVYERDSGARQKCVNHYGTTCQVCTFDFGQVYGAHGEGFIHVHHLKPLNEIGETYQVDPIKDLRPVCPNCHAMLHRGKKALSIEELRALMPVGQ